MDDALIRRLTGAAQSDQVQAGMIQMAAIVSTFYTNLIAGGVPDDLAADMVSDWFYLQTIRATWPDAPPPEER